MFAPLVLLALAVTPAPRVLPDADFALYVPSLAAAQGELAFFSRVGQRSPILDPRGWSSALNPLVPLDLTRPDTFTAVGLDPRGPSTWSVRGELKLTCSALADDKRFAHAALARLATLGDPFLAKVDAAELHGAKVAGVVQVGYVVAAHTVCTVSGPGTERTLRYTARWLSTAWPSQPSVAHLRGRVFAITAAAVAGLHGSARALTVDGRGDRRIAVVANHGVTFALPTTGLFRARGTFSPAALAASARRALALRCTACTPAHLDQLEHALAASFTGEALIRIDRFEPVGPLTSPEGQLSAMRLGAVARLSHPEAVRTALTALAGAPKPKAPDRWQIPVRGGALELGMSGDVLFVDNDATARDRALAAAKVHAHPAHALELALDPTLTANGLGRISLLDAITNKQLAGAFAFATEAVPVLRGTRGMSGWADPAGSALRFGGTWTLNDTAAR